MQLSDSPAGPGPLAGIRVIDFTAFMAGPCCSRWLADLGADVIKIEPLGGDSMRTLPPKQGDCSRFFGHVNSGKRSVALDLKKPEAVRIAIELCKQADVAMEAFRPGVMKRLGLGSDHVRSLAPRLVYCSISGFGQDGPAADLPAYAPIVHAASGYYMTNFLYQDGLDKPANSGIPTADVLTSVFAAFSIQGALFNRERTGQGCAIDVNLMDSIMNMLVYEFQEAQVPQPNRRFLFKPLRARDGFVIAAPLTQNNFHALCACTGHPEWRDDPLLQTEEARYRNWDEFMRRLEGWTLSRSAADCESILMQAGVPCSRYRTMREAIDDPQFRHRRSFSSVRDEAGAFDTVNLPFSYDGRKPQATGKVPAIGEDTAAVLERLLGIDSGELGRLSAAGIVGVR